MSEQAERERVTPEPIMQVMGGYVASQQLFVASELDLFAHLGEGPLTLGDLAEEADVPARSLRIVADGLVALGLLEKENGRYRNTPETQTFLSGETPADLRPIMRLNHRVQYPQMAGLAEAVRRNEPTLDELTPEEQEIYSEGIDAVTAGTAMALAEAYDFGQHERLLDLGGGLGTFPRAIKRRYPELEVTMFERPRVAAMARERANGSGNGAALTIVEGDFFQDPLPRGHDAVLLANIVHNFPAERNLKLLQSVREAVEPGSRLLLVDQWLNDEHTEPVFGALLAAVLLVFSGGENYSASEGRAWLGQTGWREVDVRPLDASNRLLVAEAVV